MTSLLASAAPGGGRRDRGASGIRLPVVTMRRRFVPEAPARSARRPGGRWPLGGPPLRAA